jgi:hypothetical protein
MANTSAPFGFTQRQGTGSSPTYEQTDFRNGGIDYNAAAIYYGDPVTRASTTDGTLIQGVGSAGGSTITLAGIFYGCQYLSTAQKRVVWSNYWPGSDVTSANQPTIHAFVVNDPNAQFLAQSDSTGLLQANVGSNVDYNIGTGTAANGISGAFIIHTPATGSAYPFRFVGLVLDPPGANGTASGAYNLGVFAFNNVETKQLTSYTG